MQRILQATLFCFCITSVAAQTTMNVHESSGTIVQYLLTDVDSVTHLLTPPPSTMLVHLNGGGVSTFGTIAVDSITYSPGGTEGTPLIATLPVQSIGQTNASGGGFISDEGTSAVTQRGLCWSTTPEPTIADNITMDGTGTGTFASAMESLLPGGTYYVRAYATNATGTAYGNMVLFSTALGNFTCGEPLIDARDGREYLTIQFGGQCWMQENLKYLPSVVGPFTGSVTVPYYYVHGYNGTEVVLAEEQEGFNTYGALYNWAAAMDGAATSSAVPSGVQGVCPAGWHLPSDDEWKLLEIAVGMDPDDADNIGYRGTNEGSKLAGDFPLWTNGDLRNDPEFGTTDFGARPGGIRSSSNTFIQQGGAGRWFSTTGSGANARVRILSFVNTAVLRSFEPKLVGSSVRCVKD